ncbi:MAG TPA: hypothetical protein VK046_10005 [Actinomycetaceae bacterium]|nr:hypothetical protein [Actinomycetaceae bacterium]
MPLIHVLREMRAQIHAGVITLDEAAAKLGADPDVGLTETGARDLLSRPTADVEGEYRRVFETAEIAHRYWAS